MPHLTYRKRYWRVAGDEFSVPALCSILSRIFWTILVSLTFALAFNSIVNCPGGWLTLFYLSVTLTLFLLSIFCDAKLGLLSLRGSIIEVEQRMGLTFYLNSKMVLGFVQFIAAIFGLVLITDTNSVPCAEDFDSSIINRIFVGIVVLSQFIDVFTILCCCYCFMANRVDEVDSHEIGSADVNLESGLQSSRGTEYAMNTWENRCRSCTRSIQIFSCNLFGGGNINEGFDDVAKVLTDFFHHDGFLDVVPSDVVAGIILVRLEQRAERKLNRMGSQPQLVMDDVEHGTQLNPVNLATPQHQALGPKPSLLQSVDIYVDVEKLESITRCATFSLAMYTHLIYMFMKPITGPCVLCCGTLCSSNSNGLNDKRRNCVVNSFSRCFGCVRKSSLLCTCRCPCGFGQKGAVEYKREDVVNENGRTVKVEGDNDCGLHHAGLRVITKELADVEMEYLSFKNDMNNKVFGVFLDHKQRQVVIAIRGTLSLEDCITDVMCEPVELSSLGEKCGFNGVNRYAHAGMLRVAMTIQQELDSSGILHRIYTPGQHKHRIDAPLSEAYSCVDYQLTITGHSLGAGTAAVLSLLLRGKYPNLRCFAFGTPGSVFDRQLAEECKSFITTVALGNDLVCRLSFASLCKLRNDVLDAISRARVNKMLIMQAVFKEIAVEDLMYPKGQEPDSKFKSGVQSFKDKIDARVKASGVPLCIPGEIIHLAKSGKSDRCCGSKQLYNFSNPSRDEFSDIYVSSTMGSDHLPHVYYYVLKEAFEQRLNGVHVV